MKRAAILIVVVLLARAAAAQEAPAPSRTQLGARIYLLEQQIAEAREELGKRSLTGTDAAKRLEAIAKALAELRAPGAAPAPGQLEARLAELATALDELRDEAATRTELGKYVRAPSEKEYRSRTGLELEVRGAWADLRAADIARTLDGLALLGMDPGLPARSRAILAAVKSFGDLLLANDALVRPRMLFRLTWEAQRFLGEDAYLFVSATPELQLFSYDRDLARALLPRDVASPRSRLGLIFKKAAAGVALGRLRVQVGVLQLTHGTGFAVNPTNPFTPKDPLDPTREVDGVPAARADLTLVERDGLGLRAEVAAVAGRPRNDVLGEGARTLGFGGLAMLRADSAAASLTAIGIYRAPDDAGRDSPSVGAILSVRPFGLTASVEALFTEAPDGGDTQPELVATIQGSSKAIGAAGTSFVVEYLFDGHMPATAAEASADVVRAVERGQPLLVFDRLTRPFGRRHYASFHVEPSLTQRLRANLEARVGFDEAPSALLRAGVDYDLHEFKLHAFGGTLVGAEDSELRHHPIQTFGELAVFADF